jgi:hypothetical protein
MQAMSRRAASSGEAMTGGGRGPRRVWVVVDRPGDKGWVGGCGVWFHGLGHMQNAGGDTNIFSWVLGDWGDVGRARLLHGIPSVGGGGLCCAVVMRVYGNTAAEVVHAQSSHA